MKTVKMIIQWVFVALFLICALIWCPSISSIIFVVGAAVLLPIKLVEEFFEKVKLKLGVRVAIAAVLLVVGFFATPESAPAPTGKETKEESISSSVDKNDSDKDDKKDTSKDDNRNTGESDEPIDDSDEPGDDPDDAPDEPTGSTSSQSGSSGRSFGGEFIYHPFSEPPQLGNFKDINKAVFAESDFEVEAVVGRWYEDGWLEGYYLELYGNGTWKFFGGEERCGTYTIHNSLFYLDECEYGTDVAQLGIYYDEDWGTYAASFNNCGPEIMLTRTPKSGSPYFVMENGCAHCEDLDAFYKKKYPFADLEGSWDPVEEPDEYHYFILSANGIWSYVEKRGAAEVGLLDKIDSDGTYVSEGATWGTIRRFKIADDGYLYIDGLPYEKRAENPHVPPEGAPGTYMYDEKDGGYTFHDDWTFESTPDSPFDEHGSYLFIGSSLVMYDEDGYRIHKFYQDEYMRLERHYITNFEDDPFGEDLSFVG
ncbi:MAG: hypothetical protein K6G83_16300 [Lachnospiraceae bacterium]|nr:hypothetical protein [Lachnospiraceae bacterium]